MQDPKPLLQKISTLKNLPTLPHILLKLINACNDSSGSLKEVSKIVEKDPSLAGKILRLVNSTYYGLPHRVGNMEQAVALVGTNAVKNIAICASVYEAFNQPKSNGIFNLKLFWWHSLKCGVMARLIAKKIGYSHSEEAFLSGLLHDIGKLVLWVNFPEQYENLLEIHRDRHDLVLAGEIRLGAAHFEIGAGLLHRWNLQSFMADSVRYHHEMKSRILNALPLVQIVYVANALSREPVQGQEEALEISKEFFGFEAPEVEEFLSQSDEEAKEVARSLHIGIEPPKESKGASSESDLSEGDLSEGDLSEGDLKSREDLLREVRNVSLLHGTLENLLGADNQGAILKTVEQGFQILFDIKNILFFLHDSEKDALLGRPTSEEKTSSVMEGLMIPLRMEKSLVITSLRKGKPLNSFGPPTDSAPVILDEQIIRFTGREGIVCLPLITYKEHVGVIVIGLDQAEFSHLSKNFRLLTMFTNQVSSALHVDHLRQNRLKTIQTERVGASAALARKVHHEVNNPLGIIKNYLKILAIKLSEKNIAQEEIRIINEEIDRVAQILRELATFTEKEVSKDETVDINALLSDQAKIMRESLLEDSGVRLHLDLDTSVPTIMSKKNDLKQIFINLTTNAIEAMAGGGNLYIQTRHISNVLGEFQERHSEAYHGYVEITISDDGIGIPDEIKSRLFEPFVSSKGEGHSGLGLSIVHNLIKTLNGTIMCDSGKMRGTEFKIELPIVNSREA